MKVYIFILKAQNKWGILSFVCGYVSKVQILFYHRRRQGLQKPFFSVHSAYFMILKTERGLFDEFVPRVKQQAHYISRLNSQFVKLENQFSRLKN